MMAAKTEMYVYEDRMPLKTLSSSLSFRTFSMLKTCSQEAQNVLSTRPNNLLHQVKSVFGHHHLDLVRAAF